MSVNIIIIGTPPLKGVYHILGKFHVAIIIFTNFANFAQLQN